MTDILKGFKEQSRKRRQLLAQQFGISNPDYLHALLNSKADQEERKALKRSFSVSDGGAAVSKVKALELSRPIGLAVSEKATADKSEDVDEEEVYTDSSAFLKGTQSANPHNDYCQHFVDTGERPQNFIRDVGLTNRFEEYPKLRELILRKDELIQNTNTTPMYLKCDLESFDIHDLDTKFDVILLEPPLEEYQRTIGVTYDKYWSWDEIEKLEIEQVSAPRSFIWIWCGSSDGLDAGRRCLKKWGYRRCEDICWIKTNIKNPGHNKNLEPKSVFQRTKEHCLMGIKGTVRRSTDGDFIHANIDIDLVIAEEEQYGSDEKPIEIFHIIEHFCLGRRRLHIFGKDTTIRPGWLTIGPSLTSSNFDPEVYSGFFKEPNSFLSGCTDEIEHLRPKSPPPKVLGGGNMGAQSSGPRGGGAQRGGGGQQQRDNNSALRGIQPQRLAPPPRSALVSRGGGGGTGWPRMNSFPRSLPWRPMLPPR